MASWHTICWRFHTTAMFQQRICFHTHASEFPQTQVIMLYLHHIQLVLVWTLESISPTVVSTYWHKLLHHLDSTLDQKLQCIENGKVRKPLIQAVHNCLHIFNSHHLAFLQRVLSIKNMSMVHKMACTCNVIICPTSQCTINPSSRHPETNSLWIFQNKDHV